MSKAIDVSLLFLKWAYSDGDVITNLKMQKLLYYAQAWHLVYFDKPLFNENIKAWDLGPVIPSVYNEYKEFGASPIIIEIKEQIENNYDVHTLKFLLAVYGNYIKYSAHELVNITHNEKPWIESYEENKSNTIDCRLIKEYYTKLLNDTKKKQ